MDWVRRNTVGADRIDELTELYRFLGFEVKVKPYTGPEIAGEECESCYGDSEGEYFIIYTKKKKDVKK